MLLRPFHDVDLVRSLDYVVRGPDRAVGPALVVFEQFAAPVAVVEAWVGEAPGGVVGSLVVERRVLGYQAA